MAHWHRCLMMRKTPRGISYISRFLCCFFEYTSRRMPKWSLPVLNNQPYDIETQPATPRFRTLDARALRSQTSYADSSESSQLSVEVVGRVYWFVARIGHAPMDSAELMRVILMTDLYDVLHLRLPVAMRLHGLDVVMGQRRAIGHTTGHRIVKVLERCHRGAALSTHALITSCGEIIGYPFRADRDDLSQYRTVLTLPRPLIEDARAHEMIMPRRRIDGFDECGTSGLGFGYS